MNSVGERLVCSVTLVTPLADKRLRRIINLHLVTKPGQDDWRIVQCIGELSGGERTKVELPVTLLPRKNTSGALIDMFKSQKRWGKLMGIYEPGVQTKEW